MTVRVATWNVWWRFGDHQARAVGLVQELGRINADVVCLQEVAADVAAGMEQPPAVQLIGDAAGPDAPDIRASQAADLASTLDLPHWRFAWRSGHDGVAFGNAILSRHPIRRAATLALDPVDQRDEGRNALLAVIDAPTGPIVIATTHLNFLWHHSHVRQVQVQQVCRWLADFRPADTPVILTGDLNADPMSDEVRMLTGRAASPVPHLGFHDAWEVAGDGPGNTWVRANGHTPDPPLEPDKRIDYILCSYPLSNARGVAVHAEVFGTEPVSGQHPSDHLGVLADVRVSLPPDTQTEHVP